MSNGINEVTILGNLGSEPELRYTANGTPVCNFSVAVNESYTDANGQKVTTVEWFNVVTWNKNAENCGQYLAKGRQVLVQGKLKTRSYEDAQQIKRWRTEVIANNVVFLGAAPNRGDQQPSPSDIDPNDLPMN